MQIASVSICMKCQTYIFWEKKNEKIILKNCLQKFYPVR